MTKTSFEDALMLNAIRFARFLVKILPYRAAIKLGSFIGDVAYWGTKRHPVMLKNLRAVFAGEKSPAELKKIARESFRNIGRAGIELLHAPDMDKAFALKHIRVIDSQKVDNVLKEGRGVIFLTAHFGNWELLSISGGLLGYPMTALAREQKHPRSDAYLNDLRRSQGSEIIFKGMPVREILRSLKAGRIVGILGDQDGGKSGTFVPFFGRLSSYPKGVAAFATRTGARIFPTFIFREGVDSHRIEVEGPLIAPPEDWTNEEKEKNILTQFAVILEAKIRKEPAQWLWAHRRWKSTPDRFVLVLSDGKAGHRNQSLALYETIVRQRAEDGLGPERTHLKIIEVQYHHEFFQKVFRVLNGLFGGRVPFARFWAKMFLTPASYREIMQTYADVVISAGSSVAGVNLWAARENAARSVAVMDPGFGLRHFHAIVAPKHDRLKKNSNVFETQAALTQVSKEALEIGSAALGNKISLKPGSKVVGFLAGGDTAQIIFEKDIFLKILDSLRLGIQENGAQILVTTSRRTPAWAEAAVKEKFAQEPLCPLLVIANEANRAGIVLGVLGLSDLVVVTGESISMISEAAASGKKVLVVEPFESLRRKPKFVDFLNLMENEGLIQRVTAENLSAQIQASLASPARVAVYPDSERLREAAQKISR